MSDFPYTDEQIHRFATLDPEWIGEDHGHVGYAHRFLRNLHDAGVTVAFPKPRYSVTRAVTREYWHVWDRTSDDSEAVATFRGEGAKRAALSYADMLNAGGRL